MIPEGGRPTAPTELEADRGAITAVEPQPLKLGRDSRLLIRGTGLAETGATTRVLLGQAALNMEGSAQPDLVIATLSPEQLQEIEAGSSVRLTVLVDEISLSRLIQVEKPMISDVSPNPIERDVAKPLEIAGSALGGRPCVVKLDGRDLDLVSQTATQIVARLRSADLEHYANEPQLVVSVGAYSVHRPVSVKP